MDQQNDKTIFQAPWAPEQPVPISQAADYYRVTAREVEAELQRLGVPIHEFLGQRVFYFRDLHGAHSRPPAEVGRVERTEHLDRVLGILRDSGCTIEEHPRTKGRPSDVFTVRNAEDPDRSLVLRVQICSKIQSGRAIHYNIPTASWQGVDWYWLVAPPFHPRWDFLLNKDDLGRKFGPDLKKKRLVTWRIKAEGLEYLNREHRLNDLLNLLGIGHFASTRAQQAQDDD